MSLGNKSLALKLTAMRLRDVVKSVFRKGGGEEESKKAIPLIQDSLTSIRHGNVPISKGIYPALHNPQKGYTAKKKVQNSKNIFKNAHFKKWFVLQYLNMNNNFFSFNHSKIVNKIQI